MNFEHILYATDGQIGVITMNRPARRNAQGYRMLDELDQAFELARRDEAVRVKLLRGSDGVFSTGHDLGTLEEVAYRKALMPCHRPRRCSVIEAMMPTDSGPP